MVLKAVGASRLLVKLWMKVRLDGPEGCGGLKAAIQGLDEGKGD